MVHEHPADELSGGGQPGKDRLGGNQTLSAKLDSLLRDFVAKQATISGSGGIGEGAVTARTEETGVNRVEQGARALQELATINGDHDREARRIWDRDQLAEMTKQVITKFVECVRAHKDSITAETLLSGDSWFDGLDPACMFIIRAICGPQIFTNPVLDKVRNSWCSSDLPGDLFKILAVSDNASFMDKLASHPFTWQEKTEAFVTSGLLRQVMAQ